MKRTLFVLASILITACGPRVWFLRMQPGIGGTIGVQGGSEEQRREGLERLSAQACSGRQVRWAVPELVATTEVCTAGTTVSTCDDNHVEVRFACR